jgi:hypothetical protein
LHQEPFLIIYFFLYPSASRACNTQKFALF